MYLIELEHENVLYPLGVYLGICSADVLSLDLPLVCKALPLGHAHAGNLLTLEDITRAATTTLELLRLRDVSQQWRYYTLKVGQRAAALFSADSDEDAHDVANSVTTLLQEGGNNVEVYATLFSVGPAEDFPDAHGVPTIRMVNMVLDKLLGEDR